MIGVASVFLWGRGNVRFFCFGIHKSLQNMDYCIKSLYLPEYEFNHIKL